MSTADRVPVSVLDRALARDGVPDASVLREVVDRAVRLEELGFRGVWVAEHHAVPGVAGSSPGLLAAAVAGATSRVRVGTGGIMLPAHPPFIVAETIATLESLHPGRIDAGLGASTGFTAAVRRALRQSEDAADRFDDDLEELTAVLDGRSAVTVRPQPSAPTPLFVLTGRGRLSLAARLGLGAVIGGPSVHPPEPDDSVRLDPGPPARGPGHPAALAYRRDFSPSPWCAGPRLLVNVSVAIAPTEEAARSLALPEAWALALSRSTGSFDPLQSVQDLDVDRLTQQQARRVERALATTVHGTPDQVAARLAEIVRHTGADELLVTGGVSDPDGGALSDTLLAQLDVRV